VTSPTLYVAGSRSFAAEVVDFARDAGLDPGGLLEPLDRSREGSTIHDLPVTWLEDAPPGRALVGTGDNDRRELVERLEAAGHEVVGLVHPRAHVAPTAEVAPTALVAPGVVVGARASVGAHVVIGRGALVGHHTTIAGHATLGPGANVAGNVVVEARAFVGMGAVVRDHLTVGEAAVVAMGAVAVRDVSPGTQVRGVPAAPGP
jgi:sugar O-acyltransferase (sialic acid O-acetyltransferase NeuD family)